MLYIFSQLNDENTIRKYIEDARKADCVIFYWDEENKLPILKNSVDRTIGKFKKKGTIKDLPKIYYITKHGELKSIQTGY